MVNSLEDSKLVWQGHRAFAWKVTESRIPIWINWQFIWCRLKMSFPSLKDQQSPLIYSYILSLLSLPVATPFNLQDLDSQPGPDIKASRYLSGLCNVSLSVLRIASLQFTLHNHHSWAHAKIFLQAGFFVCYFKIVSFLTFFLWKICMKSCSVSFLVFTPKS